MVAIILSLSSCATHFGLTANLNNSTTNVVLQTNNYKIIKKVKGEATGLKVLGIGGSFKAKVEEARSKMLFSANLIGKSRAVINETVEVNNKFFVLFGLRTVTVSAYVVEFTDSGVISLDDEEDVDITDITDILGKWRRDTDGLEITFKDDGKVGVFSKIISDNLLIPMEKGQINIGDPRFKNFIKTDERSWKCKELIGIDGLPPFEWRNSTLILNETGDKLLVRSNWLIYTLRKVKEEE